MQKLTLFIIIAAVLAFMPFSLAANAYVLEEFTKDAPLQAIILEAGDIVDFQLLNGTHRLRLKEIARSNTTIKLNVYPFSNEASQAQQVPFFGLDNVVKVDLNKDDKDEVILDILEIKEGRVTLAVASTEFVVESQEEQEGINQETPEITGAPQGQGVVKERKDYSKTFWVIAIAVIVLAIILYARAIDAKEKKAGKHQKEEKKEE